MTPEPLETLSLLLPEDLSAHVEYAALQKGLGLPFDRCGGKTVTRYTYTVLNYPDAPQGVQANLFVCGDQVIAGDITSLGEKQLPQRPGISPMKKPPRRRSRCAVRGIVLYEEIPPMDITQFVMAYGVEQDRLSPPAADGGKRRRHPLLPGAESLLRVLHPAG